MSKKESFCRVMDQNPQSLEEAKLLEAKLWAFKEDEQTPERDFESFASMTKLFNSVIGELEEENKKLKKEEIELLEKISQSEIDFEQKNLLNEDLIVKLSNVQKSLNDKNEEFLKLQNKYLKNLSENKILIQNFKNLKENITFKEFKESDYKEKISNLEKKLTDVQNDFKINGIKVFQSKTPQFYFDSATFLSLLVIIFIIFFWILMKKIKRLVNKNSRTSFTSTNESIKNKP